MPRILLEISSSQCVFFFFSSSLKPPPSSLIWPFTWYLFHKAPSSVFLSPYIQNTNPFSLHETIGHPITIPEYSLPSSMFEKCLLNHLAEVIEYLLHLLTTKTMLSWADLNWSTWSGRVGQAMRVCFLKGAQFRECSLCQWHISQDGSIFLCRTYFVIYKEFDTMHSLM